METLPETIVKRSSGDRDDGQALAHCSLDFQTIHSILSIYLKSDGCSNRFDPSKKLFGIPAATGTETRLFRIRDRGATLRLGGHR